MSGDGSGWFFHHCTPCGIRVTQTHECPNAIDPEATR